LTTALDNRAVIVSGGTSGLGFAAARHLIDRGARVWILGTSDDTVSAALGQLDGAAGGCACDVADEAQVENAFALALDALGGELHGAFVNAGIDGQGVPALELEADHFRRVLDVNVVGAFLVARAAARAMSRGAAIVVNASVNALRAERGFADYNASKAAAASIAQTLALELADAGIAVSTVCPGYMRTRMTAPYLDDPQTAAQIMADIPAGRAGEPAELAELVAFLLSPAAAYMTGATISIDGGRSV
jgi:NAD(P)-dependent dehydrogenase (short-subunit alcohol dehydrogenase family)